MSSLANPVKGLLAEASEKTKNYEWTEAAQLYSQALASGHLDPDSREHLTLTETLADCYFKAAFQANDRQEFRRIMSQTRDAYDNSVVAYQKTGDDITSRRMRARKTFTEYWLCTDTPSMLNYLRDCRAMSTETLTIAKANHNDEKFLYALKDELSYLVGVPFIDAEEGGVPHEHSQRVASAAEAAIRGFEASDQDTDLLECLYMAGCAFAYYSIPAEESKGLEKKINEFGEKIDRVARRLGTAYATRLRNDALGIIAFNWPTQFGKKLTSTCTTSLFPLIS